MAADNVHHPSHYNQGKIEAIDYIEDQGFCFCLGNAIKYISRCRHKSTLTEDIDKAIWYLKRFKEQQIDYTLNDRDKKGTDCIDLQSLKEYAAQAYKELMEEA